MNDGPDAVLAAVETELTTPAGHGAGRRAGARGRDRAARPGGRHTWASRSVRRSCRAGTPTRWPRGCSQTFDCPAVLENDVNLRALGEARALPADQVAAAVRQGRHRHRRRPREPGRGAAPRRRRRGGRHRARPRARRARRRVRLRQRRLHRGGRVGGAIARRLGAPGRPVPIAEVRALLARGDPAAVAAVREAAALIGELVATLVHFYNPAHVTIGGGLAAASDELLAGVRSVALPARAAARHPQSRAHQQRSRRVRRARGRRGAGHRARAVHGVHRAAARAPILTSHSPG